MFNLQFASDNLKRVFNTDALYQQTRKIMFARSHGEQILDENGNAMSPFEADDVIRNVMFDILQVEKNCSPRTFRQGLQDHGREWFRVIEDVVDDKIETGFQENEFFNLYVERKSRARDEDNIFWTPDDTILSVSRIAPDHHDFTIQRLGKGQGFSVNVGFFGAEIGADIEKFRKGQYDWNRAITEIANAFIRKFQNMIYGQFMNAGTTLPIPDMFQVSGTFAYDANGRPNKTLKDRVDLLISDVKTANDGADVTIVGTDVALRNLNYLADVNWASARQKEDMASYGRLGDYQGNAMLEVPQRFARDFLTADDAKKRLVDNTKIFVMPNVENQFIKVYDYGETEIYERNEKGSYNDDLMTYEIKRGFGATTQLGKYFGIINVISG